jgi:hypothetical protein
MQGGRRADEDGIRMSSERGIDVIKHIQEIFFFDEVKAIGVRIRNNDRAGRECYQVFDMPFTNGPTTYHKNFH